MPFHTRLCMRLLTALVLLLFLSSAAANRRDRLRERRKSLLQREVDALELLHDSLLPVGEVGARVVGGRRHGGRRGGAVLGRADTWLPDRRDIRRPAKVAVGVAGVAALSGAVQENIGQQTGQRPPGATPNISSISGIPKSRCSAVAEVLLTAIDSIFPDPINKNTKSSNSSSSSSSIDVPEGTAWNFTSQRGYIDWGTAGGPAQGSEPSCHPSCSFTNPTAAYGLTVLPLSPQEDEQRKVQHADTPKYVRENLDGRYGPGMAPTWQLQQDEVVVLAGCTPAVEASRYFGVTGYLYSVYNAEEQHWLEVFASLGDTASVWTRPASREAGADEAFSHDGHSTGIGNSSRSSSSSRFEVSGRINTTRALINLGSDSSTTSSNSSNNSGDSSTDSSNDVGEPPSHSSDAASSHSSALSSFTVVLVGANPAAVDAAAAAIRQRVARAVAAPQQQQQQQQQDCQACSSSNASAQHDLSILARQYMNILPVPGPHFSDRIGLNPTSSYYALLVRNVAPSGEAGPAGFRAYTEQPHLAAWRLTPHKDLPRLPTAAVRKASSLAGSAGSSTVAGDTLEMSEDAEQVPGDTRHGESYAAGFQYPLPDVISRSSSGTTSNTAACRSSPARRSDSVGIGKQQMQNDSIATAAGAAQLGSGVTQEGSSLLRMLGRRLAGTQATTASSVLVDAAAAALESFAAVAELGGAAAFTASSKASANDAAQGVSAQRPSAQGSTTTRRQQHALDALVYALDDFYATRYVVTHGLGSAAPLDILGVDWGLDCLQFRLDWCNGDNRDATYLSALPMVTLNRPGQVLLVAGLNYVGEGEASYMNVAITDPLQQTGLLAFDDEELRQAAPSPELVLSKVLGAEYTPSLRNLFVVAFSRDCSGVDMPCKTLPGEGSAPVLLTRPLMALSRVYVNPVTGVGPLAADLVPFATIMLSPKGKLVAGSNSQGVGDTSRQQLASRGLSNNSIDVQRLSEAGFSQPLSTGEDEHGKDIGRRMRISASSASANTFQKALVPLLTKLGRVHVRDTAHAGGTECWVGSDPCVQSFVGVSQCTGKGSWDVCCSYVQAWSDNGCWSKGSGQLLLSNMPTMLTPALLQLLGNVCAAE